MGLQMCIIDGHTVCFREGKCDIVQNEIHFIRLYIKCRKYSQTQNPLRYLPDHDENRRRSLDGFFHWWDESNYPGGQVVSCNFPAHNLWSWTFAKCFSGDCFFLQFPCQFVSSWDFVVSQLLCNYYWQGRLLRLLRLSGLSAVQPLWSNFSRRNSYKARQAAGSHFPVAE